jgi:hypothetical protein
MGVASNRRLDYESQRNDSNKYLKRASTVIGLVVLNHILSAIHASAYASALDSEAPRPIWVEVTPVDDRGRPIPRVELGVRF